MAIRPTGRTNRRTRGYSVAEMPVGLWILFVGIALPMMIIGSLSYRAFMLFWATRDCCLKAAKSPSFTQAAATANAVFNTDVAAWTGIGGTEQTNILTKPLNGNPPSVSSSALATVNTNNNIYFIQEVCTGSVQPLVQFGSWMGMNIPGLTGPYPLSITVEFYAENPQGLTR